MDFGTPMRLLQVQLVVAVKSGSDAYMIVWQWYVVQKPV